jgi:RNA 2',3'-cyclic 3'-phosphodiesterase
MFVGVWPDAPTLERLSSLALQAAPGLRLVGPAQFHVTLRFLGEVEEELVPTLVHALDGVTRYATGSVHCDYGPVTAWFRGQRVLHVPVSGLDPVAAAVREATVGVVPDVRANEAPFAGHLTVARSNRRLSASAGDAVAGIPCAGSFEVESFCLVASELSAEGPRYTTLRRLVLGGEPLSSGGV